MTGGVAHALLVRSLSPLLRPIVYRRRWYPSEPGLLHHPWTRTQDLPWNALRDPDRTFQALPRTVQAAVEAAGGIRAVYSQLRFAHRYGQAAVLAAALTSRCEGLGYASQGLDDLRDAARASPVVVVEPHVGPLVGSIAQLVSCGLRIVSFTTADSALFSMYGRLARVLMRSRASERPLRAVLSDGEGDNPFAKARVLRSLGPGDVLFWQPDSGVMTALAEAHEPRVEFLGVGIRPHETVAKVVRPTGFPVFSALCRLQSISCRGGLESTYSRLPPETATSPALLYAEGERLILENVDQWFPLGQSDPWMDSLFPGARCAPNCREEASA